MGRESSKMKLFRVALKMSVSAFVMMAVKTHNAF